MRLYTTLHFTFAHLFSYFLDFVVLVVYTFHYKTAKNLAQKLALMSSKNLCQQHTNHDAFYSINYNNEMKIDEVAQTKGSQQQLTGL